MATTSSLELTGLVLLAIMVIAGTIQVAYHWFLFSRFAFGKKQYEKSGLRPVSVIVCARNESANLRRFLPVLLDQDHPDYELIVVNDCSWDDTADVLKEFAPHHPRLKIVTIQEQERYSHGKKFALTLGIKAAKNEHLLFTDADCWPESRQWISSMTGCFRNDIEIVLGYGGYQKSKGFLNKLIRFDTANVAMNYFSFAAAKNAYMGVGRNLAYKKTLFFRNKGFAKHNYLASGDDDLLVNETATASNVAINPFPEAFTRSLPKTTFSDWFRQKRRHLTTSGHYKTGHKFHLALIASTAWMFYASLLALLAMRLELKLTGVVLGSVWLLKLPVFAFSAKRLMEKDIVPLYPVLEPLHSLLMPFPYIAQAFSKRRAWK